MPRGQRRKFSLQVTLSKVISRELTRRVRKKSIEPDIINQAALVSPRQIRDVLTPVASELIRSACHDSGCSGSHSNVASRDQKENIQHDNDSEYINIIEDDSISSKKIRCREIKSSDATSRFDEHQIDASRLRECVVEEKRLLQSSSKSRGLQVPMELEIEESRESNADNPKILCVHNDSISTGDKSSSKFKECNADGILDQNSAYASDKSSLTSFNSVSLKLHIGDMVHVTKEKHSKFGLQGMITKLTACFVYFKETTTNTTIQIKRDFVTRIAPEAPTSPLHSTSSSTNFFSVRPINDTSNNKTTSVTIHSRNQMMVCDILKPGDYVRVSKEKHPKYGSHGFIERKTNCFAFVKDSETSNTFRIKPEFLSLDSLSESGDTQETKISFNSAIQHECQQPLTGITHEVHNEATLELKNKTEGTEGRIKVKELHAKHGGKFGTIQRKTQLFHFVTFDEDPSKEVRIKSHFLTRLDGSNEIDVCNNAPINYRNSAIFDIQSWAVPPIPDNNKLKFGNFPIERVVVSMKQALDLDCVFKLIWNGRWKKVVFELDPKKNNELPIRDFTTCRTEGWELYYAEVDKTKVRGQHHGMFNQPKTVTAYYVQTEGPNVESVDLLQRELLLGDFSTLPSRKVWDRRHLSLSPAKKIDGQYALFQVGSSDIEMIDDVGTTGCGFIEEGYMAQLLGGNPTATRALAIQVRIHVPSKGIFKGMLMRKRGMARGRIELNESLQKVPPSKILEDGLKDGFITIKQMFPSDSSKQVDRIMTGAKMVTKTFTKGLKNGTECKFPPMVARIWEALNVPVDKIENYLSVSKYPANLRHSWVVGVADPTNELPPNTVFVTGLAKVDLKGEDIFVTRSPCMEAKDGRMIQFISSKPHEMSVDCWNWLCGLSFGAIIFGNPKKGQRPLPETIANGDLDGDIYFVCWDEVILSHIKPEPISNEELMADSEKAVSKEVTKNMKWFDEAQEHISRIQSSVDLQELTGKLYKKAEQKADENKSDLFIRHPDAVAYATAYKQSLDIKKHGGLITLPQHLHAELNEKFHEYLEPSSS